MPDTKISLLPAATTPTGAELIPVVQGGATSQTTLNALPVSTAQQAALNLKANLISPSLTTPNLGTPSAAVLTNATGTAAGLTVGNSSQLLGATWAAPGTIGSTTPSTGAFTTLSTSAAATVNSVTLSGNISAPAWTTSGLRIKGIAATFTDTTSSGTVTAAVTDALGGNIIGASAATTFTNYYTMYIKEGIAGPNVTMTNKWALGVDSFRAGSTGQFSVTNAGVVTFPAGQVVNGVTLTNAGLSTNFLTAAGTYAAASGGSGLPTDGSGTMTGAIATTVGTLTSSVANGASAKGFSHNTSTAYTTTAKLASWANNAVEKAYIQQDGQVVSVMNGFAFQIAVSGQPVLGIGRNSGVGGLDIYSNGATPVVNVSTGFVNASTSYFGFTNSAVTQPVTVAFGYNAASVGEIRKSATANDYGDLKLRNLIVDNVVNLKVVTVATLPSAATSLAGAEAYVTDALAPAYNTTVAGGGAVKICVVSDGTNWKT